MLEHLKECIESLVRQTHEDIEIICVVDGNESYYNLIRQEVDCVKLHLNYKNLGLLQSRNIGAELSEGEVVAFIDDDAIADRHWVEELIRVYEMGAIAAGGKILPYWIAPKPKWFPEEFYWIIGATHTNFPNKIAEVRNTFGSNLSFKKDIFISLGGFNPEVGGMKEGKVYQGGETELCNRMYLKYRKRVVYNPDAIVYHKIFPERLRIKSLLRRAFYQGYSKAIARKHNLELTEEKEFLKNVLAKITKSEFSKTCISWILVMSVGIGYVLGKLTT